MAYMVTARIGAAIRDGYRGESGAERIRANLDAARRTRAWLEALEIDPSIRAGLVEPIAAVEDAFAGLMRGSSEPDPRS